MALTQATKGRFFPVQVFHFGPTGTPRTFNQPNLGGDGTATSGAGPWLGNLGQMIEYDGCVFRLVSVDTATVATIDGGVVYWEDKSTFKTSPAHGSSEGGADEVAGGTQVVVPTGAALNYIFVQCGGDQKAVVVAASTVAGDHMTGSAATDNVLTRTAAGTAAVDKQVATALSTRGSTTSDNGASVANSSKVRWILGNLI